MPLICIAYAPCPHHSHVYLPVPPRAGEAHSCYACAQLSRALTYSVQKATTICQLPMPSSQPETSDP